MPLTKLKAVQMLTAAGITVEAALAALGISTGTNSITLSDGTTIKWGTIAATSSISGGASATITVVFDEPFATSCDFFDALVQPAITTDFYGITSLVAKSKTQIQFTVRNGATAQIVSGGMWMAIGR